MGRHYQNDTIIEALCEFRFRPETPWDATVYGLFYERIKAEYPRRQSLQDIEAMLGQAESGGLVQGLRRSPRMRFYSEDGTRLVQVGERLLVINVLKPYPHWDMFKQIVFDALAKWNDAVDEPQHLQLITLRYIDRFEQSADGFRLGEWINCGDEYFPKALGRQTGRATCQIQHEGSGDDRFSIGLKLWPTDDGARREVTLETEFLTAHVESPTRSALEPQLERMHAKIIDAFESSITDRMREMMKPLEQAQA